MDWSGWTPIETYDIADVVCNLKLAIGASTFGVDHSFRDPLSVKVSEQVDQVEVLEQ